MTAKKKVPEIRFIDLTEEWKERDLGEVLDCLYNGQTPSRSSSDYWNGQINWLSSGELNRSIVIKTIEKITEMGMESAHLRIVPAGTFVIAITGLEATGTRGNCGILSIDTTLNQSCMAIFPNKKLLDTYFLFQWYNKNSEEYGVKYTQGTKQQSYNIEIIKKLSIVLPSIKEQRKVALFLTNLDTLINLNTTKYNKLKTIKKSMLEKMFPVEGDDVPEIRFEGFRTKWKKLEHRDVYTILSNNTLARVEMNYLDGKVRNIHYGDILIKYGELLNINDNEVPYITISSRVQLNKSTMLKNGDVIIADTAEDEMAGKCSELVNVNNSIILSGLHTIPCRPMFAFASGYLGYFMNSPAYHNQLLKLMQGTKVLSVSKTTLKDTFVFYPSDVEEQVKIATFFQNLDSFITLQKIKIDKLINIKKACLEKMFI